MVAAVSAQTAPVVVPLWDKGAPGFESRRGEPEEARDYWVRSIHNPSVTVFRPAPDKANGCAVIVAPGGGLRELVFDAEGRQTAEFLNSIGVTAFVLKYRLPKQEGSPYRLEDVRQDAFRAVRLVRARAAEFGVDPRRIGVLGFSAGGGVAMYSAFGDIPAVVQPGDAVDAAPARPDFLLLVYPAAMLGKIPERLPSEVPPAFIVCANDDEYGCDAVAVELLEKYRRAGRPVEFVLFARGKHAFNMGDRSAFLAVRHWPQRMADWLADSGYLAPAKAENER